MKKKPEVNISSDMLLRMYTTMLKIRGFEEKVGELVSKKEIICPYHLYIREEAVATGVCSALRRDDWGANLNRGFIITNVPEKHQLLRRKLK